MLLRTVVIGLTAFLTVVDLFATQAILPSLTRAYDVTPAAMGFAVNSSTMGMAVAGLAVSLFSQRIDRRLGILDQPGGAVDPDRAARGRPDLTTFTILRIAQGLCMAVRFHAHARLSRRGVQRGRRRRRLRRLHHRQCREQSDRPPGLGRGRRPPRPRLELLFLRGAQSRRRSARLLHGRPEPPRCRKWGRPRALRSRPGLSTLRNPRLRAAFGIGFCILFAFIGTFTYVNFVLVRPPLSLGPMELGFVYFVFLPSIVTTLLAGRAVHRCGTRPTLWGSLALAGVGLPLLLLPSLAAVLLGMVLVGVGTFFAQATATGFVSRAATADRGSASGIYLACYFAGGLVGTAILGQVFDRIGWPACVAGIALSLAAAAAPRRSPENAH